MQGLLYRGGFEGLCLSEVACNKKKKKKRSEGFSPIMKSN